MKGEILSDEFCERFVKNLEEVFVSRNERDVKLEKTKAGMPWKDVMDNKVKLTEGAKHDKGKTRLSLISPDAEWALGMVLTFGAKKYDDWNWAKGISYGRVYDALRRHLNAWMGGEELDPESGLPHVDHALCGAMFLSHYEHNKDMYRSFDDRPGQMSPDKSDSKVFSWKKGLPF